MKDYYTLKEVILGLRKEQLKIANKLSELKKYINVCEKKYDNAHLELNGIFRLEYCYLKKISYFQKILNLLLWNSESKYRDHNISNSLKFNDEKIYFTDSIFVNIKDKEIFMKEFDSILNDEFIQIIMSNDRKNHISFEDQFLSFSHDSVYFYRNYNSLRNTKSNILDYNSYNDIISITLYYRYKSIREHINELLNLKFPKRFFSDYIQNII